MCLFYLHIDWTKTHMHAHTHNPCSLQPKCSTKIRPAALKMYELMHIWPSYDINPTDLCFSYSWTECVNVCPITLKPFNNQINNHWINTEAFSGLKHKSHQAVCQDVTVSECR